MKREPILLLTGASILVFLAGLAVTVVLPSLEEPPPTPLAEAYTPEEDTGRHLYVREGCIYCHTQQVRPTEVGVGTVNVRGDIGAASDAGDYAYDRPALWGTARQGPDLSHVASREPYGNSLEWQTAHLRHPQLVNPGTLMPAFDHLSDREIRALAMYLLTLE